MARSQIAPLDSTADKYYGRSFSLQSLRAKAHAHNGLRGACLSDISHTAERIGFQTSGVRLSFAQLSTEATLPCMVTWDDEHLVVVHGFKNKLGVQALRVSPRSTVRSLAANLNRIPDAQPKS